MEYWSCVLVLLKCNRKHEVDGGGGVCGREIVGAALGKISVAAHGRPFSHASNDDVKILRLHPFLIDFVSPGPCTMKQEEVRRICRISRDGMIK